MDEVNVLEMRVSDRVISSEKGRNTLQVEELLRCDVCEDDRDGIWTLHAP